MLLDQNTHKNNAPTLTSTHNCWRVNQTIEKNKTNKRKQIIKRTIKCLKKHCNINMRGERKAGSRCGDTLWSRAMSEKVIYHLFPTRKILLLTHETQA